MPWTNCTLDAAPVGTLTLTWNGGQADQFTYSDRVNTENPVDIADFLAAARVAQIAFASNVSTCAATASGILTQAG